MTSLDPCSPNYADAIAKARAEFGASCPAEKEQEQPEPAVAPYPLVSVGEVLKCPPLRWRVKGLIPARGIGQIYGASTAGKSFLSLDLAVHVARGRAWYGHKVNASSVAIFSLEGQEGVRNRIAAYIEYHGEELPPNISISTAPTTFYKPEDLEAIATSLPDGCLCIVDTQACASVGLDENRTDDMTLLIEGCKQLAARKDCFVLLVHHAGKDLTRGARGSSTQLPSWDCCIEATRNGQRREWKAVKVKDGGGEGEKHPFRLAVVDLGADEDGDRITSCVALPDGEAIQEVKPPGKLAKAMLAPFRAERSHFAAMKKGVEATIGNLARLEERAKPSIQKAIQTHNEKIAQEKKDAPAAERPRPTNAER